MTTPTSAFPPSRPPMGHTTGARTLVVAVMAYLSAVSATVGAAAAVVGAGIPLDLLMAVS